MAGSVGGEGISVGGSVSKVPAGGPTAGPTGIIFLFL